MPIKFCSEPYFFQAWNPQLKVPPGGLTLTIFTSWKKSIDLSQIWTREHITQRPQRLTRVGYWVMATIFSLTFNNWVSITLCVITVELTASIAVFMFYKCHTSWCPFLFCDNIKKMSVNLGLTSHQLPSACHNQNYGL